MYQANRNRGLFHCLNISNPIKVYFKIKPIIIYAEPVSECVWCVLSEHSLILFPEDNKCRDRVIACVRVWKIHQFRVIRMRIEFHTPKKLFVVNIFHYDHISFLEMRIEQAKNTAQHFLNRLLSNKMPSQAS